MEANNKSRIVNLNFIVSTKVFLGFDMKRLFHKYYSFFLEIRTNLSDKLLISGEISTNIYLVRIGEFELSVNANLKDINMMLKIFNTKKKVLIKDEDIIQSKKYLF